MNALEQLLKRYNDFSECILLEVILKQYQTELDLILNYVWDDDGKIRPNLDMTKKVVASFHLVQEVSVKNCLNTAIVENPTAMNWGLNEVALIKLVDDPKVLQPYSQLPTLPRHAAVLWEYDRRIDIVFLDLEIYEAD